MSLLYCEKTLNEMGRINGDINTYLGHSFAKQPEIIVSDLSPKQVSVDTSVHLNNIDKTEIKQQNEIPDVPPPPTNNKVCENRTNVERLSSGESSSNCRSSLTSSLGHRHVERLSSGDSPRPMLSKRQASLISLSSIGSMDDLIDHDDLVLGDDNKESGWSKLRKVVRWSPFIQRNSKIPYPWIQLAGHSGGFMAGDQGCIIKKSTEREAGCLKQLKSDVLKSFVPDMKQYYTENGSTHIEMQDLLRCFQPNSYVMDCKMGTRTYLESEVSQVGRPRNDLYLKMVSVDPSEPTDYENEMKACTKSRYMQWREQLSSTATLGFRIEGVKRGECAPDKDFKKINSAEDIGRIFLKFINSDKLLQERYISRLKEIRDALQTSEFFNSHEVIGSSLLFIHDDTGRANVWMIDFGKTIRLEEGMRIDHRSEWRPGNHEDGYLLGLANMINIWSNI